MATSGWLALGAGLLLAAGIMIRLLVVVARTARPALSITGIRVAASLLLGVAWVLAARSSGQWTPFDARQATLGLALSILVFVLALGAWLRGSGAGSVTDAFVLVLSIVGVAVGPGSNQPPLLHPGPADYLQWSVFLAGTGAVTVAGGTGLELALRGVMSRRRPDSRQPPPADLSNLLRQALQLAWLALGSGVLLATWRSWRATWSLEAGTMHESWMAAVWIIVGTSLLSWSLGRRAPQWASGLAVLAAALAVIGMLAVPGLLQI